MTAGLGLKKSRASAVLGLKVTTHEGQRVKKKLKLFLQTALKGENLISVATNHDLQTCVCVCAILFPLASCR